MPQLLEKINIAVYPTIALRGVVIFPNLTTTFELSRPESIKAVKAAQENGDHLFLVAQKDFSVLNPDDQDLFEVGIIAKLRALLRLSNGNYQVIVEGVSRAKRLTTSNIDGQLVSHAEIVEEKEINQEDLKLINDLWLIINEYLKYASKPSEATINELSKIKSAALFADFFASSFLVNYEDRQTILLETDCTERVQKLEQILQKDIELVQMDGKIHSKVRYRLQKNQREIYLREQLRAIQSELGMNENEEEEEDEYSRLINQAKVPNQVKEKLEAEARKLSRMPFGTPESVVIRNYIETCLDLPWLKKTKERSDIKNAKKILDEDHDGLEKVKERILEYIAVKQLNPDLNGQILCLVGPPGVGKTSIAQSIARATNRKYSRISLGGIRDEAEIRGHRRTYIGSMPGRIINALKLAGSSNPVLLLDELDKLTRDSHGDPTSAMLEVLDPEQNAAFRDNFIEIPYDLSGCLFIATANTTETIPAPLLDRMEVIYMNSYSQAEKCSIAKNHLIPKQTKRHGLTKKTIKFTDEAINLLISGYTKENGVRNLEREIASVCRKTAKLIVAGEKNSLVVTQEEIGKLLGAVKFLSDEVYKADEVGIVNGLAWTSLGGEMLRIEVLSMKGNGKLELTGHLGDVMKESARAAVSYIRKHSEEFKVDGDFYSNRDLHIHVPEGAIPKDGPSAGITIATAILSDLSGRTVKQNIAMTGEITLTGRVLAIGGLKEKSMAAYKSGANTVIIPFDNFKDVEEIDEEVKEKITFIPVKHISEVFDIALNKGV